MKDYGSIYTRSSGLHQGTVKYNGFRKVFYDRDKKVLQKKMNDYVLTLKYSNINKNNASLFSQYVESYLFTYKYGFIKDSSFDRLESIYKCHIKGSAIDIPLYKLNDMAIQEYLNEKRSCSKSTLKKIYNMLRMVLGYAYRRKDIEYDIASMLVLPASYQKEKHIEVYSNDEVDCLCRSIKEIVTSPANKREFALFRYSPAFIVILNTGLRAGEMLALRWSDVDLKNNVIHVRNTLNHVLDRSDSEKRYVNVIGPVKTQNSIRDVPINKICRECLFYLRGESECQYVVDNGDFCFLLLRSFQQTFKRICEYVGIPYKGLHALRHTFASRLIASGVSPKVVSDLLGHSSVVFTLNRYVHSYDEDKNNAVKMLENVQKDVQGDVH